MNKCDVVFLNVQQRTEIGQYLELDDLQTQTY